MNVIFIILKTVLLLGAMVAIIIFFKELGWSEIWDVTHLDILGKALLVAVDVIDILHKKS